ncbi:hypothetical protein NOR_02752 [Metarhizium rileyi]|uniref:Uncharacterized protein n=1 Tax=Metarhizium rileyi (strain RCEF 4871) TaxID=1649241 RepID=A0A167GUM4_METRR|nr:hypothetical protein NOR_02752 [Metarhizium rileyi RCEF 4871]
MLRASLEHQLQPSWDDESVCYFLDEFCIPPSPGIFPGYLDFLQDLVAASPPNSALRPASLASACLSLSRRSKSAYLYTRACEYYGKALRILNKSLNESSSAVRDETIATVMLLNLFEDMDTKACHKHASHLYGIVQLFCSRHQNLLEFTSRGQVYSWAFTQLQIQAFTTGQTFECLRNPDLGLHNWTFSPGMGILCNHINEFCMAVTRCLQTIDTKHQEAGNTLEILTSLVHQAIRIQAQIGGWTNSLNPVWTPKTADISGQVVVTFATRLLGIVWSLYHAALVFFYTGVLSCCRAVLMLHTCTTPCAEKELTETTSAMARQTILRMIDSICCSIPYNLGEVDEQGQTREVPKYKTSTSYYMIWPLALVAHCPYSTATQSRTCNETLERIRNMYGLGFVDTIHTAASTWRWRCEGGFDTLSLLSNVL